jgi:hypothetical protein
MRLNATNKVIGRRVTIKRKEWKGIPTPIELVLIFFLEICTFSLLGY